MACWFWGLVMYAWLLQQLWHGPVFAFKTLYSLAETSTTVFTLMTWAWLNGLSCPDRRAVLDLIYSLVVSFALWHYREVQCEKKTKQYVSLRKGEVYLHLFGVNLLWIFMFPNKQTNVSFEVFLVRNQPWHIMAKVIDK